MNYSNAQFISFEGVAGAGKSTQIDILANFLRQKDQKCFITKAFEGERRAATEEFFSKLSPYTNDNAITFIFQALHCVQYEEVNAVRNDFDYILSDRWRETFFSYHRSYGALSKMPEIVLNSMDELAFGDLYPDKTLHFDISPDIALKRYYQREKDKGVMIKNKQIDFFENTIDFYKNMAEEKGWIRIDCNCSIDEVSNQIKDALKLSN